MQSDHLTTLEVIDAIGSGRLVSSAALARHFGCSVATIKRRVMDARHLGAHIESVKVGSGWLYHLANESAVRARLARWLELERARSLVQ